LKKDGPCGYFLQGLVRPRIGRDETRLQGVRGQGCSKINGVTSTFIIAKTVVADAAMASLTRAANKRQYRAIDQNKGDMDDG